MTGLVFFPTILRCSCCTEVLKKFTDSISGTADGFVMTALGRNSIDLL